MYILTLLAFQEGKKNGVVKNKQCETMRWLIQSFLEDRVQF